MTFRTAAPTDAPLLSQLGRNTFVETFGHLYRPEDLAAFLETHEEARWAAELADPAVSVRLVEDKGVPAAYAKVGPVSLPVEPDAPAAELRQFYILRPWHGSGIAPMLMNWVMDESRRRGAQELYLSVYVDNLRARRFYDRYGFEFVAPYAFMVGEQADEDLIMRLTLRDGR
ncbi:GNAT family N-acetyltransferase [Sphingomonas parva]|uniref:GNAT family N-acetyltransferase n=1 Tax=Sphingomonas parva TaxID=2555898 RepID=A0A4Y8ZWW9_9SPHN|nr:GNAT family N-acetyltransferase [Sphingomonas parva]